MYHAGTGDRGARSAMLELELEAELVEELAEHFAAQSAHRVEFVSARIVLEKDRGQRLRRRARDDPRALGGIVLTVLRAAVDYVAETVASAFLGAIGYEADVLGRIRQPVRADRGVGDYRARGADAAFPLIGLARAGLQLNGLHRFAEVEEKARRRGEGVVKDEVAIRRNRAGAKRRALL